MQTQYVHQARNLALANSNYWDKATSVAQLLLLAHHLQVAAKHGQLAPVAVRYDLTAGYAPSNSAYWQPILNILAWDML